MAFDPNAPFEVVGGFDPSQPFDVIEPRTKLEAVKDTAIDLGRGVVKYGESLVGVADLATGNAAGKGLSYIGFDPKKTDEILAAKYSPARQVANENVASANGFMETLGALVDNPSVAFGAIVESAPMSLAGAAAARVAAVRMLSANGIKAGTTAATKFFADPKVQSALVRVGAAAEGAQTAGSIQESGRQAGKEWQDTVAPALAAGAGTAVIGAASSKVPGFRDAEATVASAGLGAQRLGGNLLASGKEIAKSMFKEGWLEELPQSMQEQIFTNLALDKPWDEGVGAAGAQGAVAGMGQGGGMTAGAELANGLTRVEPSSSPAPQNPVAEQPPVEPVAAPQDLGPVFPEKPKGPLATIASNIIARQPAEVIDAETLYGQYEPELPGTIPADVAVVPDAGPTMGAPDVLRGLESVIPRESQRVKEGEEYVAPLTDERFNPGWFRDSSIKRFDAQHGTAHAEKIKPLKLMSTLRSYLNGRQLNETQRPAWDYIKDYAAKQYGVEVPEFGAVKVFSGAHEAATSPLNETPQPTDAQKEAGNYKVGRAKIHGLDISIENPAGSERSGTNKSGKAWSIPMQDHYGYIKGTVGKDKDHLDVFINPARPESDTVFVVDQVDQETGKFDEHKLMFGFDTEEEARAGYLRNYDPGWQGLGTITGMSVEQFKEWAKSGKTKQPMAATKITDLTADPAHVAEGMDNPDNALDFFEAAIPQEDRTTMADVFDHIRKNGLHRQTSFAQQLFNMVGGMYSKRTGKQLAILGGNADNIGKKEAPNELTAEAGRGPGTSSPQRDGAEGPGAGTRSGVSGDDRQAGGGPAGTERPAVITPDASDASAPSGVSPTPPAVSTQAAEPVSATAPASSPITIEPHGSGIIVKGDRAQVRAKLAAAGVKPKGLPNAKLGGLVFTEGQAGAVRAALEETQAAMTRVTDVRGEKHNVRSDQLAAGKTILQTYDKNGERLFEKAIHIDNIDQDGTKRAANNSGVGMFAGHKGEGFVSQERARLAVLAAKQHPKDFDYSEKGGKWVAIRKTPLESQNTPVRETQAGLSSKGETQRRVHDYSNTQINLRGEAARKIIEFGKKIPDNELYLDPKDASYGREENPHVTVRYGLDTDNPADLAGLSSLEQIAAKMGKVSIFETDKYDVVKVEVDGDSLRAANKKVGDLVELPGETFTDYQPHATIAFVKKGEGQKYVGDKSLAGTEVAASEITLTDRNNKAHAIPLKETPHAQTDTADTVAAVAEAKPGDDAGLTPQGAIKAQPSQSDESAILPANLGPLYRDWIAKNDHRISAYPSEETLGKYEQWAKDILAGKSPLSKPEDFRRFMRLREYGKKNDFDLRTTYTAFDNGQDITPDGGLKTIADRGKPAPIKQQSSKNTQAEQADTPVKAESPPVESSKPASEMTAAELLRAAADKMDATDKPASETKDERPDNWESDLDGIKIPIPVKVQETGEIHEVESNAITELAEAREDVTRWEKLLDCVRS